MRAKAMLIGVIIALGLGGYFVLQGFSQVQPRPKGYREAVLYVLHQHQLDVSNVEVTNNCAPTLERCRTYAGAVTIEADTRFVGQIACRERWTTCRLTVAAAHIQGEPMPDVIDPLAWRLSQLQASFLEWLQSGHAKMWTTPRP
jgi:hypothetical protein